MKMGSLGFWSKVYYENIFCDFFWLFECFYFWL